MAPPERPFEFRHRRIRFYGAFFVLAGLCFCGYGGIHLVEIYNRPPAMFQMEAVFTPEKGRMWSQFLAGGAVVLLGVLLMVKSAPGRCRDKQVQKSGHDSAPD